MGIMGMMVANTAILAAPHVVTISIVAQTLVLHTAQATLLVLASILRVKKSSSRTGQCIDQKSLIHMPDSKTIRLPLYTLSNP